MLARRSRLQVKPNISEGSTKATPKSAEKVDDSANLPSNDEVVAKTPPLAESDPIIDSPAISEEVKEGSSESATKVLSRRSRLQLKPIISSNAKSDPKSTEKSAELADLGGAISAETSSPLESGAPPDNSAVIEDDVGKESSAFAVTVPARRSRLQVKPNISKSPILGSKPSDSANLSDTISAEESVAVELDAPRDNSATAEDNAAEETPESTAPLLARRSRLQVKPNISKGPKSGSKPTETTHSSGGISCDTSLAVEAEAPINSWTSSESAVNDGKELDQTSIAPSCSTATSTIPPEEPEIVYVDPLAPEKRVAHSMGGQTRARDRLMSYSDNYLPSPKRQRKRFTGDEELDPKKMRMMDMIYWNPKKEKGMTRFHGDTESTIGEKLITPQKPVAVNDTTKVVAPQVKLGADGRLVIDEESLVVEETAVNESVWETVEEDRAFRKVTSLSFRNRLWRKGTAWTEKETELFYEILRCTGPDFGLMHEFFPSRARNELKSKFNKEERTNWEKLKEVMSRPALLDDDLYERAAEIQREIEEEALAKKMKKETDKGTGMTFKRRKKKEPAVVQNTDDGDVSVRSDHSEDLVEEASQIIREIESEKNKRKKRKTKRIRSDGSESESEVSEANADQEPPREIELRPRKAKKLSAKAQSLLDETLKASKSNEPPTEGAGDKDTENEPQTAFDGYDEEDGDMGSIEIDSEVDEIPKGSKLLVRTRHAPEVIMTLEPIAGRSGRSQSHSEEVSAEEVTRNVDSSATSPQQTIEIITVESDGENREGAAQKDTLTSSNSPEKSVMTPIPKETELSRPRRAPKGKPERKLLRSALSKRRPPCIKSSKIEKNECARSPEKKSLSVNDTSEDKPSTSTSPKDGKTRPTRKTKELSRNSQFVDEREEQNLQEPTHNENETTKSNDDGVSRNEDLEDRAATKSSALEQRKSPQPETILKRPARVKRGCGRKIRGGR